MGSERGHSLTEMLIVVAAGGVLTAMAVLQLNAARPSMQGDGALRVVMSQMRIARELAITERRYMRLSLAAPGEVRILREEVPGPTTTVVSSTVLEGGVQFALMDGVPDTPDTFGRQSAVDFGTVTSVKFAPDGTLVNQDGASANGTVFLAIPNSPRSTRAVTVLGSTGRIRGYRWDGRQWTLV